MRIRTTHNRGFSNKTFRSLFRGDDRVIAGVCSGIAQRLEVDSVVVRVTAVVLFVCTAGLVTIPYVVLAVLMPASPDADDLVDVDPLSVASDRYQEVVEAKKTAPQGSLEQYGVQADAGHVPPRPPQGKDVRAVPQAAYIAYRHTSDREPYGFSRGRRAVLVATVAAAAAVLFLSSINSFILRHPEQELINFWPVAFIVVGITFLVCFYDCVSFAIRVSVMLFCLELCGAFLPFALGICPPWSLERIGAVPVLFAIVGCASLLWGFVCKRSEGLVVAAIVFIGTLVFAMIDMGLFERSLAAASYSTHNITSPLFRS